MMKFIWQLNKPNKLNKPAPPVSSYFLTFPKLLLHQFLVSDHDELLIELIREIRKLIDTPKPKRKKRSVGFIISDKLLSLSFIPISDPINDP
jgi:hypothetical protein